MNNNTANFIQRSNIGFCIYNDGLSCVRNDVITDIYYTWNPNGGSNDLYINDIPVYSFSKDLSTSESKKLAKSIMSELREHIKYNIASDICIDDIVYKYKKEG